MYGDFKMVALVPRKPRDWSRAASAAVFVSLMAVYAWRLM